MINSKLLNISALILIVGGVTLSPAISSSLPLLEGPSAHATASSKKVIKRGAPLSKGEVKSIDEVAKNPEAFSGKQVLVSGTISAVCKVKGCWMTLAGKGANTRARVTFKDYAFFVPKDGKGMRAVMDAEVKIKMMSDAERQHLADDGGVSVDQIPKVELRLVASGLEIYAQ